MTLVLRWAWRHYALYVNEHETLASALRSADYASEMGEEALDYLEVWDGGEVRIITKDEAWKLLEPIHAKEMTDYLARAKERPEVATIEVQGPEKKWAHFSTYTSMEEAQSEYDRLTPFLGERVRLTLE